MPSSRTPAGTAAAAVAFLLPVAFSPLVYTPFWSPKVAVGVDDLAGDDRARRQCHLPEARERWCAASEADLCGPHGGSADVEPDDCARHAVA